MTDYQRRVLLALTAVEADALNTACEDMKGNIHNGWDVPAGEVAALGRAHDKLHAAQAVAARRNAEKAAAKAARS